MPVIQFVVFSHDIEGATTEYGVPIEQVREIIRVSKITPLPQTFDFIEGIINLRGKTVPVIDLKKRFAAGCTEYTENTRIIIFDIDGRQSGILVDEVTEVLTVSLENIEPIPPILSFVVSSQYLKGIAKVDQRLIVMLDLNRIIPEDQKQQIGSLIEKVE